MQIHLVERARSGDHEAFADLAAASFDRLYALATLILRDGDRAEDAVQESLVAAWRDIRALRDVEAWDAWLHRLTVRACYRVAGRERRRRVVEVHVDAPVDQASAHDFAASLADRDVLERAIARLPIDQRAVLVVHFYLDLPLTAAADVLGIPVGTAKSRLHYGLRSLRASLDAPPVPEPAPRIRESTS
jgi:RNA polymerase sigma-70 factor (ECF subfamily)